MWAAGLAIFAVGIAFIRYIRREDDKPGSDASAIGYLLITTGLGMFILSITGR